MICFQNCLVDKMLNIEALLAAAADKTRKEIEQYNLEEEEARAKREVVNKTKKRLQIARSLGRADRTVIHRINKLKRNGDSQTRKSFSLEEDQIINDNVVDALLKMSHKSLKQVSLSQQIKEMAKDFNRTRRSVVDRWELIRLWILSCYQKTLNLDIRSMLVDYLVNNFDSRATIDWDKVLEVYIVTETLKS